MSKISNARVVVRDNETLDSALMRFNRKVNESNVLRDTIDKRYHRSKKEVRDYKRKLNRERVDQ